MDEDDNGSLSDDVSADLAVWADDMISMALLYIGIVLNSKSVKRCCELTKIIHIYISLWTRKWQLLTGRIKLTLIGRILASDTVEISQWCLKHCEHFQLWLPLLRRNLIWAIWWSGAVLEPLLGGYSGLAIICGCGAPGSLQLSSRWIATSKDHLIFQARLGTRKVFTVATFNNITQHVISTN